MRFSTRKPARWCEAHLSKLQCEEWWCCTSNWWRLESVPLNLWDRKNRRKVTSVIRKWCVFFCLGEFFSQKIFWKNFGFRNSPDNLPRLPIYEIWSSWDYEGLTNPLCLMLSILKPSNPLYIVYRLFCWCMCVCVSCQPQLVESYGHLEHLVGSVWLCHECNAQPPHDQSSDNTSFNNHCFACFFPFVSFNLFPLTV